VTPDGGEDIFRVAAITDVCDSRSEPPGDRQSAVDAGSIVRLNVLLLQAQFIGSEMRGEAIFGFL
jgi:hypothetical protein